MKTIPRSADFELRILNLQTGTPFVCPVYFEQGSSVLSLFPLREFHTVDIKNISTFLRGPIKAAFTEVMVPTSRRNRKSSDFEVRKKRERERETAQSFSQCRSFILARMKIWTMLKADLEDQRLPPGGRKLTSEERMAVSRQVPANKCQRLRLHVQAALSRSSNYWNWRSLR